MTRSSLLKKFDTKVQALYDQFVEDIEEVLSDGEASVEVIKGFIADVDEE